MTPRSVPAYSMLGTTTPGAFRTCPCGGNLERCPSCEGSGEIFTPAESSPGARRRSAVLTFADVAFAVGAIYGGLVMVRTGSLFVVAMYTAGVVVVRVLIAVADRVAAPYRAGLSVPPPIDKGQREDVA